MLQKKIEEKGITLIALVVTIVLLIIIASIAINVGLGDNGLIKKAQNAKDMAEDSQNNIADNMNKLVGEYANSIAYVPISNKRELVIKLFCNSWDGLEYAREGEIFDNWEISIFSDASCENLVRKIVNEGNTDKSYSTKDLLPVGTYYVRFDTTLNGYNKITEILEYKVTDNTKSTVWEIDFYTRYSVTK